MTTPIDDGTWSGGSRRPDPSDLLAPKTQIVPDREAYLGQGRHDVGRRISDDQIELFISADVAGSLQQEFALHRPEFIAVHDVGNSASLRLLVSLAGAAGARVQRLMVRRQGHGVPLAVLQFVEVPLADGAAVRVYSTDLNADSQARVQVARVLLSFSTLGVLLVGELPPHALTAALTPLRDAVVRGPWSNRDMLMVPLGSSTALAAHATHLTANGPVAVHVTPRAGSPRQAWSFIGGAWNRLHALASGAHKLPTELELAVPKPKVPQNEAATEPMPLREPAAPARPAPVGPPMMPRESLALLPTQPMVLPLGESLSRPPAAADSAPAPMNLPVATPMPVPGTTHWQHYIDRCMAIKGSVSCCVFDVHSTQPLASAGATPSAQRLAETGASLLAGINDASRSLGLGSGKAEAAVTAGGHHLLLRPVPRHPGIAVHVVLLASAGNLTLARMQLERIEPPQ